MQYLLIGCCTVDLSLEGAVNDSGLLLALKGPVMTMTRFMCNLFISRNSNLSHLVNSWFQMFYVVFGIEITMEKKNSG